MRESPCLRLRLSRQYFGHNAAVTPEQAVVRLDNATFYRQHPLSIKNDSINPPIFPNLTFSIPSSIPAQQHWAIIGPSNAGKTTFLEILRGHHVSIPPTARSYPYLSSPYIRLKYNSFRSPSRAIQYVGFDGQGGGLGSASPRGAYMSARYESRKEETDFSVMDYLTGNTELNPSQKIHESEISHNGLRQVIDDLRLGDLIRMPVGNLSNGQNRRARIAKALLGRPEVLLLDEPFMGLDPASQAKLSPLLFDLAKESSPRLLLALRPQDPIPGWITHLMYLMPALHVASQGSKNDVLNILKDETTGSRADSLIPQSTTIGKGPFDSNISADTAVFLRNNVVGDEPRPIGKGEPVVQMDSVVIKYGNKRIVGGWTENIEGRARQGLNWTVRKGERWGVFGPNGSGKTTLISIICSDHPQAYAPEVRLFGRGRLPQPGQAGLSIFDIQKRIGQSSPEIHAFFPRNLTLRQTIENAWAETFLGTPKLDHQGEEVVDSVLQWFEPELNPYYNPPSTRRESPAIQLQGPTEWADSFHFRDVSFSSQRLALFLRAIVKKPELVVLDEAFSGMDDIVRDKCMLFLTWGNGRFYQYNDTVGQQRACKREIKSIAKEDDPRRLHISGLTGNQALICVSHIKEEVPDVVREWLCLPEAGESTPARFGRLDKSLEGDETRWNEIWGV